MSGPSERDEIAAVLAGHRYRDVLGDYEIAPYYKHFGCSCGWQQNIAGMSGWRSWLAAHDQHLAALLAERDRRTAATAWDDGFKAGQGSMLVSAGGETRTNPHREVRENGCGVCLSCDPPQGWASRMYVCATCGNKRCPAAGDCLAWECSGSNEPGQKPVPRADQ